MTEEGQCERLGSTYLCFRSLFALRQGSLSGALLLVAESPEAERRTTAGRIAGAAVLLLLGDAARARRAVRTGAADFLVTSIDEALRILRMDVRRGTAVGVCLHGAPTVALAECVERGVQPEYLDAEADAYAAELRARGARPVPWLAAFEAGESPTLLPASGVGGLDNAERRHWMRHAPAVLGRRDAGVLFLPLRAGELALKNPRSSTNPGSS